MVLLVCSPRHSHGGGHVSPITYYVLTTCSTSAALSLGTASPLSLCRPRICSQHLADSLLDEIKTRFRIFSERIASAVAETMADHSGSSPDQNQDSPGQNSNSTLRYNRKMGAGILSSWACYPCKRSASESEFYM